MCRCPFFVYIALRNGSETEWVCNEWQKEYGFLLLVVKWLFQKKFQYDRNVISKKRKLWLITIWNENLKSSKKVNERKAHMAGMDVCGHRQCVHLNHCNTRKRRGNHEIFNS